MSETELPNLVLPGELLGTAEEFLPGFGTYEDHGRIFAALMGRPKINAQDRAILVEALNAIPRLADGNLVYARVDEVKSAMAICTIVASASSHRGVPGAPEGTVHISKAKEGYTEALSEEFQSGDLLLARILQSQPTVKLTTAPAELGVVAARCSACHALLALGTKDLVCPRCGNRERRKLAKSYGSAASEAPDGRAVDG